MSAGILAIQYRNQIERRHGEIVQLKTQITDGLNGLQRAAASLSMNIEIVRIELRRLPDSDRKFNAIEKLPRVVESVSGLKTNTDRCMKLFSKPRDRETESKQNAFATPRICFIGAKLVVKAAIGRRTGVVVVGKSSRGS
jgi:hypothetical protein